MVGIKRRKGKTYDVEYFATAASNVANHVKNFPAEWTLPNYAGITEAAYQYLRPLIQGQPDTVYKDGLPAYVVPYYFRTK